MREFVFIVALGGAIAAFGAVMGLVSYAVDWSPWRGRTK